MSDSPLQEVTFTLGGATYTIRPTFRVLASIEQALDQPSRTLGLKVLAGGTSYAMCGEVKEVSVSELSLILFHMTRGEKTAPMSAEAIGEILLEEGYADLCKPVSDFLLRALKGNKEHVKEKEAEARAAKNPQKGTTQNAA